jgi:hypothetical protein
VADADHEAAYHPLSIQESEPRADVPVARNEGAAGGR